MLARHSSGHYLHGIQFSSPSQIQYRSAGNFNLIAGTPLNGTWRATAFFPRFSEAGTWAAELVGIKDAVSNSANLSTADLVSRGFPSQLIIFKPSTTPDGAPVGPAGGTVTDAVFGDRARVVIPAGTVAEETQVAIDVLDAAGSPLVPIPAGYSAPDHTLFVNIDFDPRPAMPFPFPGLTLTLPFSTFQAPGRLIRLLRFDPGTGSLVPAVSVSGGPVTGKVNADGLSATFTGVAHLSTIVGAFPTAVSGDINGDGAADCADLLIVRAAFGKRTGQAGFDARADFNQNGVIDVLDLAVVTRELSAGTTCR